MSNNPIGFNDPTGHMQENEGYKDGDGQCDDKDKGCNSLVAKISQQKKKNENVDRPGKVDFVSVSAGLSVPSIMILTGGLMCISAVGCEVGGPLASTGMELIPTFVNALSIGPVFTLDSYGNTYLGLQLAAGKTVPGTPIGAEIVGYKINSSSAHVTEAQGRDFITGWNFAANAVGFPGMSGFRLPPTGQSLNPVSGETATSGTFAGTTLAEASVSYTWELPINIGHPVTPWALPSNGNTR